MATSAPKTAPKLVAKGAGTSAAPEGDDGAPVIKKKSKKKTILIASVAAVVLGAAGGAAYYFTGASDSPAAAADPDAPPAEEAKAKAGPEKPPLFVVVEPFTVNLQHEGPSDQFLQISFSLQLSDQKQEELFKLYQPQARSRLLLLLSGKKASEISSVEGKKKLAEEIAEQLRIPFSQQSAPLDVKDVFFTSFVIQ
ncbi:MAG: flagellar basal body-associated protein FliL [Burkholderiaceae bacterium]